MSLVQEFLSQGTRLHHAPHPSCWVTSRSVSLPQGSNALVQAAPGISHAGFLLDWAPKKELWLPSGSGAPALWLILGGGYGDLTVSFIMSDQSQSGMAEAGDSWKICCLSV